MQKPVYKRELSHSYLVISDIPEDKVNNYQYRMIIRNRIAGLLPCSERFMDGKTCLYYDISSRQSLAQVYEAAEINYDEIRGIIDNLTQVQNILIEYLLRETGLVLEPEYIYMDLETEQLFFLYYPLLDQDEVKRNIYLPVAEFFLEHVNHGEEKAVSAAYQFYKMSKLENFTIESFRAMMERGRTEEPVIQNSASELLFQEEEGIYEYRLKTSYVEPSGVEESGIGDFEQEAGRLHGDQPIHGKETFQNKEKSGSSVSGKRKWTVGTAAAACTLLFLCIAVWYLQPIGQLRIISLSLMAADGILLLICLGKMTAAGRQEKAVPAEETEPESEIVSQPDKFCQEEFHTDDIDAPTVFIGSGFRGQMNMYSPETKRTPRLCMVQEDDGTEYALDRLPVMVGKLKSKVQILLPDASVSRIHARFVEKEGQVALIDMNSTNGTYVNDIRLEQAEVMLLEDGDAVRFGNVEMRFSE